jgi:hypothetical protein
MVLMVLLDGWHVFGVLGYYTLHQAGAELGLSAWAVRMLCVVTHSVI